MFVPVSSLVSKTRKVDVADASSESSSPPSSEPRDETGDQQECDDQRRDRTGLLVPRDRLFGNLVGIHRGIRRNGRRRTVECLGHGHQRRRLPHADFQRIDEQWRFAGECRIRAGSDRIDRLGRLVRIAAGLGSGAGGGGMRGAAAVMQAVEAAVGVAGRCLRARRAASDPSRSSRHCDRLTALRGGFRHILCGACRPAAGCSRTPVLPAMISPCPPLPSTTSRSATRASAPTMHRPPCSSWVSAPR